MSERDGWNHLYLYDAQDRQGEEPDHEGRVDRPRRRPRDEEKRQIWFRAGGIYPGAGPVLHPLSAGSTSTAPAW